MEYKYKFHELLLRMPVKDYWEAMEVIPKALHITKKTWKAWIYIKLDQPKDIPACALLWLSNFFNVDPHFLKNELNK